MTILLNSIKRTQRLIKRWSSLNQSEVDKFAAMSSDWWDQVKNSPTDQSCKSSQKPLVVSGFLVVAPKTFSGLVVFSGNPLNH